jgi:cbb3-type cytochrome oxidase subunit 1
MTATGSSQTQSTAAPQAVRNPDGAAVSHLLVSTLFLVLGGGLVFLSLAATAFPGTFSGMLALGRLKPAAYTLAGIGWLVIALVGAVYYMLPRLTGTALWRPDVARAGMAATALLALLGAAAVLFGFGDGIEPFGMPWWLDLPMLVALSVPFAVTVGTVRNRTEDGVYVSMWFVLGGVAWLPLLYLVNMLPGLASVGRVLQEVTFGAGFATLWITTVGTGVLYFVAARATKNPLSNRQLARVGFWSLAVASIFAGPAQVAFGATPDWLDTVSAVLLLALPVAALANAYAISTTLDDGWAQIGERPALLATVGALGLILVAGITTATAGFKSASALVGFTSFWDGITYLVWFGVGGLAIAAWAYQALPAMTGRELASDDMAMRHLRYTIVGVGATAGLLMVAGVIQGFAWNGAAFTGTVAAGEGWAEAAGATGVLLGLAALAGLVALGGQLIFALNVYRTITSGRATAQEILVERTTA